MDRYNLWFSQEHADRLGSYVIYRDEEGNEFKTTNACNTKYENDPKYNQYNYDDKVLMGIGTSYVRTVVTDPSRYKEWTDSLKSLKKL